MKGFVGFIIGLLLAFLAGAWIGVRFFHHSAPVAGGTSSPPLIQSKATAFNIVLVSVDALRADLIEEDQHRELAPFIHQLKSESIVIRPSFSLSSWTLPSHMTMITGIEPHQHGINLALQSEVLDPKHKTLGEILRSQAYSTAWAASLTNKHLFPAYGFTRGIQKLIDGSFQNQLPAIESWLKSVASPFFLFAHTAIMHDPYFVKPETLSRFRVPKSKLPRNLKEVHSLQQVQNSMKWGIPTEDEIESIYHKIIHEEAKGDPHAVRRLYDLQLPEVDEAVRLLVDSLKRSGQWEKTIFVLTSDHGEEFMEHGGVGHHNLYAETTRVPLIIRIPGLKPAEIHGPAGLHDLVPTLLSAVGLAPLYQGQGLDLLAKHSLARRELRQLSHGEKALIRWPFKLHQRLSGGYELYRIDEDPKELHELQAQAPDQFNKLRSEIELW